MEPFVLFWFACGIAAALVSSSRGDNPWIAAAIGLFLGPIGLLIVIVTAGEKCPKCDKRISKSAGRCPHCHSDLAKPGTPATDDPRTAALIEALKRQSR